MHPDIQIFERQNSSRVRMGKIFNRIVQALTGLRIRETQCGFKGFRNRVVKEIFGRLAFVICGIRGMLGRERFPCCELLARSRWSS
jgi:hypothetical protein